MGTVVLLRTSCQACCRAQIDLIDSLARVKMVFFGGIKKQ